VAPRAATESTLNDTNAQPAPGHDATAQNLAGPVDRQPAAVNCLVRKARPGEVIREGAQLPSPDLARAPGGPVVATGDGVPPPRSSA
jgi:hypothetical protein